MQPIPRTFCISLRETPKRREEVIKYFNQIGMKVEMFDGIHAEQFGIKTTVPNYSTYPGREYFITQGLVGCLLSHLTLWNVLIHQPEDEFFILEDDVIFCDDFFEKFAKFKLELPEDWEFVQVGWLPITGPAGNDVVNVSENISIHFTEGTHAYLVKKSALKTLIETNQLAWSGIDVQIRERALPKLKHYTFDPSLVSQRSVKNVEETTWFSLCYDWLANPEWLKNPMDVSAIMGQGWYPLEKNDEGYMIWSDGRGEFLFNKEWNKMKIDFIAEGEMEKKLRVVCPNLSDQVFEIKNGLNSITFSLGKSQSVILITDTFKPSDIYKTADCRRLGIRLLKGITLYDNAEKGVYTSLYSMYGQKRFGQLENKDGFGVIIPNYGHENGRINLNNQIYHKHHRFGWKYVLNLLLPYHKEESVVFDGFLEHTFAWKREQNSRLRFIPYREPWVGVFHNPPNTPSWVSPLATPSAIISSREFQDSLGTCKGLYTLSKYHAEFLRCYIKNIPIETLCLPSDPSSVKFSFDEFVKNNNKKVVNVGFWLRKLSSIYKLDIDPDIYQKIRLVYGEKSMEQLLEVEQKLFSHILTESELKSVVDISYMPDAEYDELLSKNVVFLDLHDNSANNTIVECIARGTPLLVNPLPAVVEYLGEGYPFYFTTLGEASKKLKNLSLIKSTHEYLVNSGVAEKVSGDFFLKTIRDGAIWKSLA